MSYGKYTYGAATVLWHNYANLIVGKFCSIASNVTVYLGGNHRTDWVTTFPFGNIVRYNHIFDKFDGQGFPATKGNVTIGNDVWIADNVTIMSGVTIADGAVIAANSHVVKDVGPYTIVGGNPAKEIRKRFNDDQIAKLLQIKWWDWDDEKINNHTPLLCSNNIDDFITKAIENQ